MDRKLAAAAGAALVAVAGLGVTTRVAAQGGDQDEAREIAAVGTTKLGLPEAVAAAEAHAGGKAVDAGLEAEGDRPVFYNLLVSKDGGLVRVRVDPATGAASSTGEAGGGDEREPPGGTGIDLGHAIRLAEAAAGSKALEAGVEQRDGAATYVVETVAAGKVSVHRVDPASGRVSGG